MEYQHNLMASETSTTIDRSASKTSKRRRTSGVPSAAPFSAQAPAGLAAKGHPAGDEAAWQAWQKHLVKRRTPKSIDTLCHGKAHPLLWSVPEDVQREPLRELLSLSVSKNGKNGKGAGHVASLGAQGIGEGGHREGDSTEPLRELVIVHLLPVLAGKLAAETWWDLLDALCRRSRERRAARLDEDVPGRVAWADQVLAGELPLALAYQFPELRACADLAAVAHETLTDGLLGLTDGEGLLHALHVAWLRPLFACWTRCQAMAEAGGLTAWSNDAQTQYEWLVPQALRLTRGDGSQIFGRDQASDWEPGLFGTALDLAGDDGDLAAAQTLLPKDVDLPDADDLPCEPAVNSEWSRLAVLRTDWQRPAPCLGVNYAERDLTIELQAGRETILAGAWHLEVLSGGRVVDRDDHWEEVCWFSDDDVDYLELSAELAGGGRVDRQILLAREDDFLFLCDNVIDAPAADLEYVGRLPLAAEMNVASEEETREVELVGKKPRAVVMPLALPEWRIDPRYGQFAQDGRSLELRQKASGRNMACPLFLDLAPRRLQKRRTWRQLTVAESLEICPRETAVAYRVQCGKAQWVFYRSLAPISGRTFFGQNVSAEFFAGRFHRDGEVEELLEIE